MLNLESFQVAQEGTFGRRSAFLIARAMRPKYFEQAFRAESMWAG
jgi:hypothetical protein